MKIVVDTNVVFSAILNSSGKIGQILMFARPRFTFYAPQLVKLEIRRHQEKILALGGYSLTDFEDIRDEVFGCITFVSEEQIPFHYWQEAVPIVREVDMDDIAFVVLTNYLDANLWTGDKKLLDGISKTGFVKGMSTVDIYQLSQNF